MATLEKEVMKERLIHWVTVAFDVAEITSKILD